VDVQLESISSDEENEASLDVSSQSYSEDESLTDSDRDVRPEHHSSQVCAFH